MADRSEPGSSAGSTTSRSTRATRSRSTRLRREAPVAWNAQLGYWAVSRHADVVAVSSDSEQFCSGKGILTFEIGVEYPSPPTMMHTDPPEHTRYRKLVQPGFAPSVIRALEPAVRERVSLVAARVRRIRRLRADRFGAVPADDHQRAARRRRRLAALLRVVGGVDSRRGRHDRRRARSSWPRCTSTSSR